MGPSGNRKLGKIGTKWDQVETGGENWEKLGLSGTKTGGENCGNLGGTKWKQKVETGGENWEKLGLSWTKWKQVKNCGTKWNWD